VNARRRLLLLLGAGALVPVLAVADAPQRVPRIGFLASGNPVGTAQYEAFLQGLRELGYVDGRTIRIELRWLDRDLERLPALAAELAKLPVDVLVAWSSPAITAAKKTTTTTPIVMIAASDPVGQGFVASLAKPGGNVTGLSNLLRGTIAKNVEMLLAIIPGARRLAVLRNPGNPSHELVLQEVRAAAADFDLRLQIVDVNTADELGAAFAAIERDRAAGLVIFGDPLFVQQRQRIAEAALQARLPSTTIFRQYPEAGGLMSYGLNTTDHFRRAATFVDRILKGARPAELPVEQPATFQMLVNLRTAKAIGLRVPESLLLRADRVIE
jgi:putative ABC transport system substrate-binding protein